ncbi:MAG: AurF N-oxygenase family protein [Acidimicrobiales bacterium]
MPRAPFHPTPAPTSGPGATRPGSEADTAFWAIVERLSRQSVDRHFDAYADIDWDSPEMAVHPHDPRWALSDDDPLAGTRWYRELTPERQAHVGLHRLAVMMRTGWEFENLLQRGLLTYAFRLPNGRREFRYVHHEVIEESQHTMMFQELVNRTGLAVRGMARPLRLVAEWLVLPLARVFPELFFLFVLGGEDPIDHVQRRRLRQGVAHPLAERIMRIHVTEEARHLSFARHLLKTTVPRLGPGRRLVLAVAAPVLLAVMAPMMLAPSASFAADAGVPRRVVRRAARSDAARARAREAVGKVRRLWRELGLVSPLTTLLWRGLGLWDDDSGIDVGTGRPVAPADWPPAPDGTVA